jgi:hypothetical protein
VTDAELRNLLQDALRLWDVAATVEPGAAGLEVRTASGTFTVARGPAPARWFLQAPARRPRPAASVTGLLSALRHALGVTPGGRALIGAGAG